MTFDHLKCLPQYIVPHHLLTRLLGYLANIKQPFFKNLGIRFFIWCYGVNMQEAIEENPQHYTTFNAFFIRALKPTARPIANKENNIVSPADGTLSQLGLIEKDRLLQAKNHTFNCHELLGGNIDRTSLFLNGHFATFYLSPKDYHRVHMPLTGTLQEMIYIPGSLFSVNSTATEVIPELFSRNERLVCIFQTAAGPMAVILIGAMIVGSIHTKWTGAVTPPHKSQIQRWDYATGNSITLNTGDELGHFQLGSSVIVMFGKNAVTWDSKLTANTSIKMGQALGILISNLNS